MESLQLLLALCAPAIHPATASALVQQESSGNPFAIHVNGLSHSIYARSEGEAIALASRYIQAGYSVDMGYAQISSTNLRSLGLTVGSVFKPCVNLSAMQAILITQYGRTASRFGEGQQALQGALSAYNTGSAERGLSSGYVSALHRHAQAARARRCRAPDAPPGCGRRP